VIVAKIIDGKKYMWDGIEYEDENEANSAVETYSSSDFEVKMVKEGSKYYVFTRRVVTDVKVEGTPPI
jgi:regulation of enolase protein 1 (concanavalin A-like superfamily)